MNKFLLAPIIVCLALAACSFTSEQDKVLEIQKYNQIMKGGSGDIDPVHGKETSFFYGAISGTGGTNANGIGYIRGYEDGAFTVTVNLNIALPEVGSYFAYLRSISGDSELSIGELKSIVGDVRHTVKLETKQDVSQMLSVQVRLEDSAASVLVAEGTLKEPVKAQN